MEKHAFFAIVFVLVFGVGLSQVNAQNIKFDTATVIIAGKRYQVELAQSPEQRAQGLMFRKTLCEDCGMLFHFSPIRQVGMWMKNTYLPLDIAFISSEGVISDIKTMQPHDLNTTMSSGKVAYALEMNQGWFKEHAVKEGDTINIDMSGVK
ncbi:DUF192 domain-containing protein [Alteromonas sp. ASW11-130]|uniref:DUF192 domain-containing protein n=1 Tax=Alteromonas sp. ASW11-130 TaxID=3015775 RepID=UPI002241D615|nr:DUF192 domain-containing protein [Alteromonas sp. ASW11-130]MCW8090486.1 DUF192 domain-containing protein [Alteromonas sp. ASW11-130]